MINNLSTTLWIFDLDDTLTVNPDLSKEMVRNSINAIQILLSKSYSEAYTIRSELQQKYYSVPLGLSIEYKVPIEKAFKIIHNLKYQNYLKEEKG